MSKLIKKIAFKGLEKKEQILFKSFLNLVKNDLVCDVELIKDPDALYDDADIVIGEASYAFIGHESEMSSLPMLKIGDDANVADATYLVRPVQWSDFKAGLILLTEQQAISDQDLVRGEDLVTAQGLVSQDDSPPNDAEKERILPTGLALEEPDQDTVDNDFEKSTDSSQSFSDASAYNFSLEDMSVDYENFTNSAFEKVADDVKEFQEEDPEPQAIVLVSDDESRSSNSVLVIETNSLDAWDLSESEFDDSRLNDVESASSLELPELSAKERKVMQVKLEAGEPVQSSDVLWMSDQEILAGPKTLFVVLAEKRKVYSNSEPGKWIKALRSKELRKIDVAKDWQPSDDLISYPLERLIWVNALVGRINKLDDGATDNDEFMLLKWPNFELLELDNVLLKITTMLFVGPESAYSLMQKTGESRAVIYGMLNACKELGILVAADDISKSGQLNGQDGVFGKLKDVFR